MIKRFTFEKQIEIWKNELLQGVQEHMIEELDSKRAQKENVQEIQDLIKLRMKLFDKKMKRDVVLEKKLGSRQILEKYESSENIRNLRIQ